MASRFTIEEMKDIALHHGGKCLSKAFINVSTPLAWMCARGHTWDAPYTIVRQGGWCVVCAREEDNRLRLEKVKGIAAKRGGKCTSKIYIAAKRHLDFECKFGHKWKTSAHIILNGSWCPKCAGKAKPTLDELHQIAKSRGGKFLSKSYVNNFLPLKWECKKGHQWTADYSNVKNNETWCPHCYGNVTKSINDVRHLAKSRGGKCLSSEYINNRQILDFQCAKGHVWRASTHQIASAGSWCPYCAGKGKRTINDMQVLAQAHRGKCLSVKYVNSKSKLKWQCKEGHVWMTTPGNVVDGCWCPKCALTRRSKRKYSRNGL